MENLDVANMSIPEIINTAIYNEKMASDFYLNIANMLKKVNNAECADFFMDQAEREKGHYNSLFKYKSKIEDGGSQAVGETVKWVTKETGAGQEVRADISIDDALHIVEERESDAETFYNQAAEKCGDDEELRKLFLKLAEEEAHHHYLIQKMRTTYEQKGVIEAPDMDELGYAG